MSSYVFGYNVYYSGYRYTLTTEGLRKKIDRVFNSRQEANDYMYKHIVGKYGLTYDKIWDDNHEKTYLFKDGVRVHINRAY